MSVETQKELIKILSAGKHTDVLGTPESEWLDFKQAGYQTMPSKPLKLSEHGRHELCKDVSAMANKYGGVILLGYRETLSPSSGLSVADQLKPIKVTAIDLAHYKHVLQGGVYPVVDGMRMNWYHTSTGQGVLAIIIPKRTAGLHITRNIDAENEKQLPGVAIYERMDDQTYIYPAEKIYELMLATGSPPTINAPRTVHQSFDEKNKIMREMFRNMQDQQEEQNANAAQVREFFINANGWDDAPLIIIQSIPISGPPRLDNFYDEVERAFINAQPVRSMGFSLNSLGGGSDTIDGAFIKTGTRDAALRLDPDGTLTLAMKASEDFLGWAMSKQRAPSDVLKLNSIVLLEITFEFVRFIEETLTRFGLQSWRYCLYMQNLKKYNAALYYGGPGSMRAQDHRIAAKDKQTSYINSTKDYAKDVFNILVELYAFFTLPPKAIPYTSGDRVTKQNIIDLNKNINGL